jgi:NAD(P)-dependent dehydrogenase (short-subunit alcohol dehydrogenase family)
MHFLATVWNSAKTWRSIPLGPVSFYYRLGRKKRVSSNFRRSCVRSLRSITRLSRATAERAPLRLHETAVLPTESGIDREQVALIVGAGPGLGFAIARKLALSGMSIYLAARNAERLDAFAQDLRREAQARVEVFACDATDERSVRRLIAEVGRNGAPFDLVIYAVQGFGPGKVTDVEVPAFEQSWRQNCLGGFIVAREAARRMQAWGHGTIILIGSTSGMTGRAEHVNLAVGKFGLRALAQVLAQELWSRGVHVAHLVIDADIREDASAPDTMECQASPEHIADVVYALHRQPKSAWTHELDVRPWNQQFWSHC